MNIFEILKSAIKEFGEDRATRLSAALAYYAVFSLAPILLIAISIAGFLMGEDAARGAVESQLSGVIGSNSAELVEDMIKQTRTDGDNLLMGFVGLGILIFSATGVMVQLKESLNIVWEVKVKPGHSVKELLKARATGLSLILSIGFLLLCSLVLSTVVASLSEWFSGILPAPEGLLQLASFLVSFVIITLLFAMIFKILPDVEIAWKDVWVGAAVTSGLFSLGKFLLALYLGREGVASPYGASGALVLILLWAYYNANILFFGAEITQAYVKQRGRDILPSDNAIARE